MYAIVKTGGKQYRVERGQTLLVERLSADEGSDVTLDPILYRSEEAVFDKAGLDKVKVTAKVLAHERGEKLRVFKFKPKRGYKRRTGHRQELTRIEVTDIALGSAKAAAKPATAKARSAPKAAAEKTAVEKGAAEKRPTSTAAEKGTAKPAPPAAEKGTARPEEKPSTSAAAEKDVAKPAAAKAPAKKPAATKEESDGS